jgi:hypothetical protein
MCKRLLCACLEELWLCSSISGREGRGVCMEPVRLCEGGFSEGCVGLYLGLSSMRTA